MCWSVMSPEQVPGNVFAVRSDPQGGSKAHPAGDVAHFSQSLIMIAGKIWRCHPYPRALKLDQPGAVEAQSKGQ